MNQEDEMAESEALGELGALSGGLDLAQLGDREKLPGLLQSVYKQQLSAIDRQEAGAKSRFEAAQARIAKNNAGPSQSEMLFALSRAMLSPKESRGFKGFVQNMSGAFSDISAADRKAREQREAQLAQLQDAYATQGEGFGVTRAKTAADLVKTAAPLLKTPARSTTSPVTVGPDMVVRSRATGVALKEPPLDAIYTLQSYLGNPANTLENKMIAKQNFDKRFGYGSSDIYGERN